MTERPILFSGPMVRALLAGTKTQTRRVIGLPSLRPSTTPGYDWTWRGQAPIRSVAQQTRHAGGCWQDVSHRCLVDLCPYGAPGDRLWVRECWGITDPLAAADHRRAESIAYRADGTAPSELHVSDRRWRPSIHMPRWASRLTLEVTSVRVERVQSITEEDARAEGVTPAEVGDVTCWRAFRVLWDEINGEREGWAANPWVWVVGFRVVPR